MSKTLKHAFFVYLYFKRIFTTTLILSTYPIIPNLGIVKMVFNEISFA